MGIVETLIDLVMTPGASLKLVPAINVTLVLLLGVLVYLGQGSLDSHHLYTMAGLAIGLLLSVNWFIIEFRKEKEKQAQLAQAKDEREGNSAVLKGSTRSLRRRTD
jgi:hypothetical protein